VQLGHDTLIAAVLLISAGLTIAYAMVGSRVWRNLALIGAAATIVIALLLLFGLA
jgi:cytochrome c oxidase subunit IV